MFHDIDTKQSFTTFTSQIKHYCSCGNINKSILTQKLQEILTSLTQDINQKQKQLENIRNMYMINIRQKQQIIERLINANDKISIENQMLWKKLARKQCYIKSVILLAQAKYKCMNKQLSVENKYLKQRNQQLKRQILDNLNYKPQQLIPIQYTQQDKRSRRSSRLQKYQINYNYTQQAPQLYYKSPQINNRYLSPTITTSYGPSHSSSKYQSRLTYTTNTLNRKKSQDKGNEIINRNKQVMRKSYVCGQESLENRSRSSRGRII